MTVSEKETVTLKAHLALMMTDAVQAFEQRVNDIEFYANN